MSNKLHHNINMKNFIKQIAAEHDLIDELVANAVEAAASWVRIIRSDNQLIIWNDGLNLSLLQIKQQLLTAFETGDDKSFDTNRGLGFIALYKHSSKAIINTGTVEVLIQSWDDIITRKGKPTPGFRICIELLPQSAMDYSYQSILQQINDWIYWEPIQLLFGSSLNDLIEVGQKFSSSLEFIHHPKYKYQNLKYSFHPFETDKPLYFLYKLTNVNIYRPLPIDFDLSSRFPEFVSDQLTMIISHGAYLDSTRRSLTKWGMSQVSHLLELLEKEYQGDQLRRLTFRMKASLMSQFASILEALNVPNRRFVIAPILTSLGDRMKNHPTIIQEGSYIDKFLSLLVFTSDNSQPSQLLSDLYRNHLSFLEEHRTEITPALFHNWLQERLGVTAQDFFSDIIIGFLLDHGDVSGQLTVNEVVQQNLPLILFDNHLFQSAVIHRLKLAVALHGDVLFFADFSSTLTNLPELIEQYGSQKPSSPSLLSFHLDHDEYEKTENASEGISGVYGGIPYLNYTSTDISQYFSSDLVRFQQLYHMWRASVKVCLVSYDPNQLELIIPVVVIPESSAKLACFVHNFAGISFFLLNDLQHPTALHLLIYAAIHEVAHIYCRPHSTKFHQISTAIYQQLLKNKSLNKLLRDYTL